MCEAIYRAIPSLKLQGSNIACTFVSSGYPENQSEFLRKVQDKDVPGNQPTDENSRKNSSSENNSSDDEFNTGKTKIKEAVVSKNAFS